MSGLVRRLSRKRWSSHHDALPSPQETLPEDPHNPQNAQPRPAWRKPSRHSLPGTLPQPTASQAPRSTSWLTTLKGTRILEAFEDSPLPRPSTPEMPLLLTDEGSTGSRSPSTHRSSRASSRAVSSSAYPTSPLPTSSPSNDIFIPSTTDGQPPWDRRAEVVWTRYILSEDKEELDYDGAFRANLERLAWNTSIFSPGCQGLGDETLHQRSQNADNRYLQLPDPVRLRIMRYVLASHNPHDNAVRMNNPVFLWEAWPVNRGRKRKVWSTDYFDSLENVLSSLDPYTSVCSAMRADVLATLFLVRRFHVVYSPLVGRESQPAATKYMDTYGPLMASITVEVDFTKLGGGWKPEAASLNSTVALKRVRKLVEGFVESQLTRKATIQDLRVLVRRYYGARPALNVSKATHPRTCNKHPHKSTTTTTTVTTSLSPAAPPPPVPIPTPTSSTLQNPTPAPYTPDAQISQTLHPLKSLGPLVSRLTLTGSSEDFATELITSLWGDSKTILLSDTAELAEHITWRVPGQEYPLFPCPRLCGAGFQSGIGEVGGAGEGGGKGQRAVVDCGTAEETGCGDRLEHHQVWAGQGSESGGGGGGVRVVGCGQFDGTGKEWEGEYGCRLLLDGEKAGEGVIVEGLDLRKQKEKKRRRRISRRVLKGVLTLSSRSGTGTKVGGVIDEKGTIERRSGEKDKGNGEGYAVVETADGALEEMGPGEDKVAQRLFRRIASEKRRGLFGQY